MCDKKIIKVKTKIVSNKDINLPKYLNYLLRVINKINITKDKEYCICEYQCLNYPSYTVMRSLV